MEWSEIPVTGSFQVCHPDDNVWSMMEMEHQQQSRVILHVLLIFIQS